jgi:DNA-binding MarR family transcriptional regulator
MPSENTENGSSNLANEQEITLGILRYVQNETTMTQRSVAKELGIALGMANFYLKHCIRKGWVKVAQAPANRYLYYLTPGGFAEKSELTREYLFQSFNFFRHARLQCSGILTECEARGWKRILLIGAGELADIMALYAGEYSIKLLAIVDSVNVGGNSAGLNVVGSISDVRRVDAVVLTDLTDPQGCYEKLLEEFAEDRILVPALLDVSKGPQPVPEAGPSAPDQSGEVDGIAANEGQSYE